MITKKVVNIFYSQTMANNYAVMFRKLGIEENEPTYKSTIYYKEKTHLNYNMYKPFGSAICGHHFDYMTFNNYQVNRSNPIEEKRKEFFHRLTGTKFIDYKNPTFIMFDDGSTNDVEKWIRDSKWLHGKVEKYMI